MRAVCPLVSIILLGFAAQPGAAQEKNAPLPKVVSDVIDCQTLTDQTARLTCFDKSVAALAAAHRGRDVLIADKEQLRETRKGLFGLDIPAARLFTGSEDKEKEDVETVESVIRTARITGGKWSFVIEDGAHWLQVDNLELFKEPRGGTSKIVISRGAMGSFFAKVDGQRAIRVKRVVQ